MKRLPLHRRTRQIIAGLAKELGTEIPWQECFAEIGDLDDAVRKTFAPAELDALAILDEPVVVGGTKFYALTLNAEDWFEEWCKRFPDAPEMQMTGLLYASAHSMDPEALLRTWTNKGWLAARVWLWRCRCGIKRGQVEPLTRLIMPDVPWPNPGGDSDEDNEGYSGYGWLSAALGGHDGDVDYWRNKVPMLKALQRYRNLALYGEGDSELRRSRWEQWREDTETEAAVAIRTLKDAWQAVRGPAAPSPSPTPSPAPGSVPGASEGKETASTEKVW